MEKHICHHLLGSLSDFIDGSLSEELCDELERHLAECENCRIVVDTLQKTISLYQAMSETPEVPADVRQRLYLRLDLADYLAE